MNSAKICSEYICLELLGIRIGSLPSTIFPPIISIACACNSATGGPMSQPHVVFDRNLTMSHICSGI